MKEIWEDIEGYEGKYQVSNLGKVKSLPNRNHKEDIILKTAQNRGGYLMVGLWKKGKPSTPKVHRLVAKAFISNPENKRCVCHKDNNPQNNKIDNLYWGTDKENIRQAINDGIMKIKYKPVCSKDINNNIIKYASTWDAQRKTGIQRGHISQVCSGLTKSAGGLKWFYISKLES